MRRMKEKVQSKLVSMSSILLDDILIPNEEHQEGDETVSASYYDKYGNKFTFTLSLTVVPKYKEDDPNAETPVTTEDQIGLILEKIENIDEGIGQLKQCHNIQ